MKVWRILPGIALLLALAATPAQADSLDYEWLANNVKFTLSVEDFGDMVGATLTVDRTADPDTDLLAGVSLKIFSDGLVSADGILTGAPSLTWIGLAGAVGGKDGLYSDAKPIDLSPTDDGFYSAVFNALGGEPTGSTQVFEFLWDTSIDPLLNPSIKALTVETKDKTVKKKTKKKTKKKSKKGGGSTFYMDDGSRQWSSGDLDPVELPNSNPEPGTLVLMALVGAGGYAVVRWRRRRA